MKRSLVLTFCLMLAGQGLVAQTVFRSTQSANLPTASMLRQGNWMFEISHRFGSRITDGAETLFGLDGPVNNRLGMTWAAHERLMLQVQRSNFRDNVELNAKVRLFANGSESLPVELAAQGGVAWNTQIGASAPPEIEENESQAYAMLIANALLGDRVAVGVVPVLVNNADIGVPSETTFLVGLNGQVYFNGTWSFLGEWIVTEDDDTRVVRDSGAFGFEIRTRGHFFKILVTNQLALNPAQVFAGTGLSFGETDDWRLGFNITRLLPF